MMTPATLERVRASALTLGIAVAFAACDETPSTGPDPVVEPPAEVPEFTQTVSVPELASTLTSRAIRVDVSLAPDGLVAQSVRIAFFDDTEDDEVVRSHIAETAADGATGSVVLALGGLTVDYDENTVFLDSDGEDIGQEEFFAAVAAMDGPVGVRAERSPAGEAQAPGDPDFLAGVMALEDGIEHPSLDFNVDFDNLTRNESPPPDGWLTILGLEIELRVTEGITKIEVERPELDRRRFHDEVVSVDLEGHSVTLANGTIVRIVDRTHAKYGHVGKHRLRSLEGVARALAAGLRVTARGKGVVESESPLTLIAIRIEFRVHRPRLTRFEGKVESVDPEAGLVKLANGTVLRFIDHSVIHHYPRTDSDLETLERVKRALDEGLTVIARGVGFVTETDGDARVITVIAARFKVVPQEGDTFEGEVESVDLENRSFKLKDGPVVELVDATDLHPLPHRPDRMHGSLEDVQEALDLGLTVLARGRGELVEGSDPPTIIAVAVAFALELQRPESFEGRVVSVAPMDRSLTLDDGTVVRIIGMTDIEPKWRYGYDLLTFEAIARAVDAGLLVVAAGRGELVAESPVTIIAAHIEFHVELVAVMHFEGEVASVDLEHHTFTITDGPTVRVVDGTRITARPEDLASLAAVSAAIDDGATVIAQGAGAVMRNSDPQTVIGLKVHFTRVEMTGGG